MRALSGVINPQPLVSCDGSFQRWNVIPQGTNAVGLTLSRLPDAFSPGAQSPSSGPGEVLEVFRPEDQGGRAASREGGPSHLGTY